MNALARFEEFVEDLLEGSLTQLLRSPVQPAEIARRLERAMERGQRAAVGKILVPTCYHVFLHTDDYAALAPARGALEREMARFILNRARECGFSLLTRPRVSMESRQGIRRRRVLVEAEIVDTDEEDQTAEMEWTPALIAASHEVDSPRGWLCYRDLSGNRCEVELNRQQLTIGRARDNDLILDDARVSRYHARVVRRYGQYVLQDLGSTHGTAVNGEAVRECVLRAGDLLCLGGVELSYEER